MSLSPAHFEQGLNPAQKIAVTHQHGPMLVLAGAGSGKTRVITQRIARLLALGTAPHQILAVTFTNKAAGEMTERVHTLVGAAAAKGLVIGTFHSFGLHFLQRELRYLGFQTGFTIFDSSDAIGAIREILRHINVDAASDRAHAGADGRRRLDPSALAMRISLAKNSFQSAADLPDGGDLEGEAAIYEAVTKTIYPKYVQALRDFHAVDFDDLICEPVRLLNKFSELREKWQKKFRYILVDEYQDTNRAQLELLKAIVDSHQNIMVVGDDDQSIYGFRGADVSNLLDFEHHFSGAKVVKLEQNYRSREPVLKAANAVIGAMPGKKYKKELFTTRPGGPPIEIVRCALPEVESSFVASEIARFIKDEAKKPSEIAVMYRSNKQAALIEESLRERGIAYQLFGGQSFFDRKEVKDVLSYLRLAIAPNDEIALRRVINYPSRGIGDIALAKMESWAIVNDQPLCRAIFRAAEVEGLGSAAIKGATELAEILLEAKTGMLMGKSPAKVARELVEAIKLKEDLHKASPSATIAQKRWGNIEGLYRSLERFEQRAESAAFDLDAKRAPSVQEFLHRLTLRFAEEEEAGREVVTLTTLHGAKGLEYEIVFLIGLEEGILPHKRTIDPNSVEFVTDESGTAIAADDGIDEERRLFYVGVTRAKERLFLCRSVNRNVRGRIITCSPSRFLSSVPKELCQLREVSEIAKLPIAQLAQRASKVVASFGQKPKF